MDPDDRLLVDDATDFLRALLREGTKPSTNLTRIPYPDISDRLIDDIFIAYHNIVEAVGREYKTAWLLQEYSGKLGAKQDGRNTRLEERLHKEFQPIFEPIDGVLPVEHRPSVVVDNAGVILMWYLPGMMTPERQEMIFTVIEKLGQATPAVLSTTMTKEDGKAKGNEDRNWRGAYGAFKSGSDLKLRPGVASFSPAWWAQGHDGKDRPVVSTSLRGDAGEELIQGLEETLALLGAILSVVHPELYHQGMKAIRALRDANEDVVKHAKQARKILESWAAPFTALSIIVNRQTILHRDTSGPDFGMDILLTGGRYDNGRLETPGIGMRWVYNPGTVVAILGKVLMHGVGEVNGERYCVANFFRKSVLEYFGAAVPPPPKLREDVLHARWMKL